MKCHGFRVMGEECFLWGLGAVGGRNAADDPQVVTCLFQ